MNEQNGGSTRSSLPRWFIGLGGSMVLAIAIFVIKPWLSSTVAPTAATASSSIWSITSAKDAMTDVTRSVASAEFQGVTYNVQVHITCADNGLLRYEANTYDRAGKPAELRGDLDPSGHVTVRFGYRAGDEPAAEAAINDPQFNNQIYLENWLQYQEGIPHYVNGNPMLASGQSVEAGSLMPVVRLARASKVALRLPVAGGDETISFEQSNPALRKMLAPCLSSATTAQASGPELGSSSSTDYPAVDPPNAEYYNDARRDAEQAYRHLSQQIVAVLGQEAGANELCRGSSDQAVIAKWCPIRDRLVTQLKSMGMCYGRPTDESAADSDWHLCNERGPTQNTRRNGDRPASSPTPASAQTITTYPN